MKLPWISVEDRLPEHDGTAVLVWVDGVYLDAYFEDGKFIEWDHGPITGKIVHWLEVVPPEETGDA